MAARHKRIAGRTGTGVAFAVAVFVVGILAAAAASLSRFRAFGGARSNTGHDAMLIVPARLELGEAPRRTSLRAALPIRNPSTTTTIDVERVSTTCACTSVTPASFKLGPGEAISLDLAISSPELPGVRVVKIDLISDGRLQASSELAVRAVDPIESLERTNADGWVATVHEAYRDSAQHIEVYPPLQNVPIATAHDRARGTVATGPFEQELRALDFVVVLETQLRIAQTVPLPTAAD